jgi:hypothetical protein
MECGCKWYHNVSTLFCLAWENESVDVVGRGIHVKWVDVFHRRHADGSDVTFYNPESNKKLLLIQRPKGRYNKVFRILRLALWCRSATVLVGTPEGVVYVTGVQVWNIDLLEVKRDVHWNQDSQISTVSVDLPVITYTIQVQKPITFPVRLCECRISWNEVIWLRIWKSGGLLWVR